MAKVFQDDEEQTPSVWGEDGYAPAPQEAASDPAGAAPSSGPSAPQVFSNGESDPSAQAPASLAQGSVPQVFSPLDQNEHAAQAKLAKLQYQDANPWGTVDNHPGTLGKIAHGASVAAQIAGNVFAPHLMAAIPGTEAFRNIHEQQLGQEVQGLEQEKEANRKSEAETANLAAQPEIKALQNQNKVFEDKEKLRHNHATEGNTANKNSGLLAEHGLMVGPDGSPVADINSPFYKEQQMKMGVQQSQQEVNQARTAVENMKGDPNSVPNQLLRERLALASGGLQMRQKEYMMHAFGTGDNGEALPGAMIGDDGRPVGTANAPNVRPTASMRDTGSRAQIAEDTKDRILGELQNPQVRSQLGPMLGRAHTFQEFIGNLPPELATLGTDLTSYAAYMAGQHPVKGIGALQYFDKVIGGLGQTPEQLEGKLKSTGATSADVIRRDQPRVQGSEANAGHGGNKISFTTPDGNTLTFSSQKALDIFKQKLAGAK